MPESSLTGRDDALHTIPAVLRRAVSAHADKPAAVGRSGTLSYADLDRRADAAAGALWRLGVRPGERIAACLPNDLALPDHGLR